MFKRDLNFNFNYICDFDISEISNIVKKFDKEWLEDIHRQNLFKEHLDTASIMVTMFPLMWEAHHGYHYYSISDPTNKIEKVVRPLINFLENHFDGKNGRTLLTKLRSSGGLIPPHIDNGYYLQSVHRCHVPIITNDQVDFVVNKKVINMKVGECYEINNKIFHGVKNNGPEDRVHLIIDIIPNKAFKL